ncbi:unnamed protein product [Paramecium pentaurelia]|uniref:H-type lectin domain-containing protein n=1 Tax=Paramecium pentaurelia TaxID=43138 RepID=A0A8S1US22_9CILI|nr:unnamed protein product [Paramecium pentaurelia]
MKLIALSLLYQLTFNLGTPQFETGLKIIMMYGSGHILETQSTIPRQIIVDVQFSNVFESIPCVFIQTSHIDWIAGEQNGFIEKVSFITTTGFKMQAMALTPQALYSLQFYWFSISDSRLQVITYDTWDVKNLKIGSGERTVSFTIEHNLKDATQGIISLLGVKHIHSNPIVELKVDLITSQTITVSARTYQLSQIEFVSFNVLLGTAQSLWASSMQSLINAPNHPFVSRESGPIELIMSIDLPQGLENYQLIPIATLRGYNLDSSINFRLTFKNVQLTTNLEFTLRTWVNSIVYEVYYQGAVYLYNSNFKIFDLNCAELFSECNFQGNSIVICEKISDLLVKGWSNPIRSITVPAQRKLLLYYKANYEGDKREQTENQQCIEPEIILSAKFLPQAFIIKILFFNIIDTNNCQYVKFFSECNYQGTIFQISQGEQLSLSNKIPFEIKSINICPNVIVTLKAPNYFGGAIKQFTSSQSCINSYKFPKYVELK